MLKHAQHLRGRFNMVDSLKTSHNRFVLFIFVAKLQAPGRRHNMHATNLRQEEVLQLGSQEMKLLSASPASPLGTGLSDGNIFWNLWQFSVIIILLIWVRVFKLEMNKL